MATLSTAAGPDVAAAAADAAISALRKENPDVMNFFAADQHEATGKFASYETQNELGRFVIFPIMSCYSKRF